MAATNFCGSSRGRKTQWSAAFRPNAAKARSSRCAKQRGDLGAAGKLDEGELAIAGVARDARKNLIVLRQIFGQRLGAPEHGGAGTQTKRRAIGSGRRGVRRLVIDRQIGQPDQPLGVVLRAVGRLHQVAREIIVERRQAAGVGMTPGIALHRREPLRRQLRRHPVHADFGINDHVRRVGEDRLPPGVERTAGRGRNARTARRPLRSRRRLRPRCNSRTAETGGGRAG